MNKITLDFFLAKSKTAIGGLFVLVAFLLMNTQTSWGQTAVSYTAMTTIACPATPVATISAAPSGLTFSQISRGSGVTCGAAGGSISGSGFNTTLAASISGSKWYTFTITSDASKAFTLNSLSIVSRVSSATGSPNVSVQYSIGGAAPTNVIGSYTPTGTVATYTITPGSAISVGASQVLRIYIIPNTLTASGTTCRVENNTSATVTTSSAGSTPPTLTADATANTVDNNLQITFTDDVASQAWVSATTTSVTIGGTPLTAGYSIANGVITFTPSASVPAGLLQTAGASKPIIIIKEGYSNATVSQTINAGAPTATNSTATISATLAPNTTRTITATAKDQYNNLVSGYTFGYDVTVTNNTGTTTESYTIDGSPFTTTSTGNPVTAFTNASGVATFTAALPVTIDPSDGLSIQVQLADDTTNVGSSFSFTQLAAQTITFGALSAVTYGGATFDLTATASSTLPVSYASSNTAVATVSGSTVTIVGAGSTNITASQAGNGSFNAAIAVIQALTVNAIALTLPDAAAASRAYNTLLTTNITGTLTGIINADDVTFDGILKGTFADANVANGIAVTSACTLAGTKAGNYTLTQPTGLTANITKATQTITFAALTNKVVGDANFTLSGTASSTLTVAYASSNTAVATVSGNTVTIVGAGSTNITASQAGNANYTAASDVVRSLTVTAAPIVAWEFAAATGSETSIVSTTNATNMATSTITRGAGLTASTNSDRFNATNWAVTSIANAVAGNNYMEFTVAPNSGYQFSVSSMLFQIQRSATGLSAIALRSSIDGYASNLDGEKSIIDNTSTQSFTFTFAQANSSSAITYRLYGYSEQAGGSAGIGDFTGNDIVVTGTIQTITSTTWNGTSWTSGTPLASINAIIDAPYSTSVVAPQVSFSAKNLTVNSTLTVATGSVTVAEALVNNGTIIVENNASLIQTAAGVSTNTGSGTATVKRESNLLKRLDYTMWSSPVSGTQTLAAFSPLTSQSPNNRFYTYNAGSNVYSPATFGAAFEAGKGYLIRMPNEKPGSPGLTTDYYLGNEAIRYNGEFTGTLNNGNLNLGTLAEGKFYAVGNPYPSPISASSFIAGTTGLGATLYFWRKTNGTANDVSVSSTGTAYATWTSLGGTASGTATPNNLAPNGQIAVGQGFIVNTGTATTINFTNAMRTTTAATFLKTKEVATPDRIWLNLTNATGAFSQTLIGYTANATLDVDNGIDGEYINDSSLALTSNINNKEYTIQGRPTFDPTDVVALNFKTNAAGDYSIALDHFDGVFAATQDVYLVDNTTGAETNLKEGGYAFNAAAGTDNARFSLKYQKTLKVDAPAFNDNSVKVYKNNGAIYVNSTAKTIKTIEVYDVQGRLIAQQKNVNAATATIQNVKAVSQMLIVKVSADDNSVVSKKVLN